MLAHRRLLAPNPGRAVRRHLPEELDRKYHGILKISRFVILSDDRDCAETISSHIL